MLQNDFYKILDSVQGEAGWIFHIQLNADHRIYEGHFPDQPIVPGVCTLQIIKECAETILKCETRISQMSSCKYLAVVNPIENPNLEIQISLTETVDGTHTLLADGKFGETNFIKVKATLTAE